MRIYQIAKVVKEDPRLIDAAKKVIDQKKMIREVASEYYLSPEQLSEAVVDLRRERSLPVDLILQEFDRSHNVGDVHRKVQKLYPNISLGDVVWLLRKLCPLSPIHILPEEIHKVIELREKGVPLSEISNKLRIAQPSLGRYLRKYRPDLMRPQPREGSFWDKIYLEYLGLINDGGKNHKDAAKELMDKYMVSGDEFHSAMFHRGWSLGGKKATKISEEEANKIIDMARKGASIFEISNETQRETSSVRKLLIKLDPQLYNEIIKPKASSLSPDVLRFIIGALKNRQTYAKIIDDLYKIFNLKIGYKIIRKINKTYLKPADALPAIESPIAEPPITESPVTESPDKDYIPFGGIQVRRISPEEYRQMIPHLLTKEDIEKMRREKLGMPVALSKMNWYKTAQQEKKPYKIYKITNGTYKELTEFGHIWAYSSEQARIMVLKQSSRLREFVDFCKRSNSEGDIEARIDKEEWQSVQKYQKTRNEQKEKQIQEAWWNK